MKTHNLRIIAAGIIIIAIFCISIWLAETMLHKEVIVQNNTSDNLIREIQNLQTQFGISKWESNPVRNEITLYVYDVQDENIIKKLQGKQIENFTVKIIQDTEFESTRSKVTAYLTQLQKNPDYQIARISMVTDAFGDPPGNYAEVWVYKSTPENQKLEKIVIQGWTVLVYPMAPLPTES